MAITRKMLDLLSSGGQAATGADEETEEDREVSGLYECESCVVTFISATMEECPQCAADVQRVPTERELGML